jgi:hypothetical protein
MTKVNQVSKPLKVTCTNATNLQLKQVPAAAHSSKKPESQTVGAAENNTCANSEGQKQNDR